MSHYCTIIQSHFSSMINMKIGAANSCQCDLHDSIGCLQDLRVRNRSMNDLFDPSKCECLHDVNVQLLMKGEFFGHELKPRSCKKSAIHQYFFWFNEKYRRLL